MSVASMSKFVQQTGGRRHFRCQECVERAGDGPVSGSPLRVLHLYVLVSATDRGLTPLRMKPLRLVVEAPPDKWGWGVPGSDSTLPEPTPAKPGLEDDNEGKLWRDNAEESVDNHNPHKENL